MGLLLGAGLISPSFVWWFQIVVGYLQVPLACWAMSGKACSPFWWAPERMPTTEQRAAKAAARHKAQQEAAASRAARGLAVARSGRLGALVEEIKYFVSPFQTPAFRWLWLQSFVATVGALVQGYFTFYWFQDCFPDGYYVFGWKLSNDVSSAVAINGMVGAIVNSAVSCACHRYLRPGFPLLAQPMRKKCLARPNGSFVCDLQGLVTTGVSALAVGRSASALGHGR